MAGGAYESQGEADVHDYLTRRSLPFDHEPSINGRRPDFVVRLSISDVVLEVYEPDDDSGEDDSLVGVPSFDGAFKERKRKQARASRTAGMPFVAVVRSRHSDGPRGWMGAVGALRGRPGFMVSVGPGAPASSVPKPALLGGGNTRPGLNTSYSALAVVHKFNPTAWRLRAAQQAAVRRSATWPAHEQVAYALEAYGRVEAELRDRGLYEPDRRAVRLAIFHNPDAAIPLPLTFAGRHDEQWADIWTNDGPGYGPVALGRDSREWLDLD